MLNITVRIKANRNIKKGEFIDLYPSSVYITSGYNGTNTLNIEGTVNELPKAKSVPLKVVHNPGA